MKICFEIFENNSVIFPRYNDKVWGFSYQNPHTLSLEPLLTFILMCYSSVINRKIVLYLYLSVFLSTFFKDKFWKLYFALMRGQS